MKVLLIVSVLAIVAVSNAQRVNYLENAFANAMAVKRNYDEELVFFRERLTWQADDFGYYFTVRMRYAIARATTEAEGATLQGCASVAAFRSRALIDRFDEALRHMEHAANNLFLSIYEQFMEMNVKKSDMELFYYLHSYRMEDAELELNEIHIPEAGNRWMEMWFGYFNIADELDDCIFGALD